MSTAQGSIPFQTAFEMDESFKVNRWGSGPTDQGVRETFMRYASGNQMSRQHVESLRSGAGQSQKRYVSEVSQMSNLGDGFKKTKYNQMETLKQLRQEYEILRNLPLQDEFLKHSHTKKSSEYNDSHRESDSVSSSSKQTDKKHHHRKNSSSHNARNTQILTLQKRQLELVIGNSMRKIQELLNSQIQYKKIIHELQLQLDSRSSEDKIENLTKTMKRNESELNERIQNLKREIERLKQLNKQLQDKNDLFEAEIMAKNQELRKCRDEKRVLEDELRLEKDKFLSLQIDMKRIKMESELLEKEKSNEINRLNGLLQLQPRDQTSTNDLRRLQQDLRSQKQKYEILLNEFERYKREASDRPREIIREKSNDDQMRIFEALINHLREESANQNRASMDLINSMVAKIDEKNERKKHGQGEGSRLLEELFHLRNEVSSLKREKEVGDRSVNLIESMADYQNKIKRLEDEIADGTISKENLMKEYENVRSSLEYARSEYDKLNIEYQRLREQLRHSQNQGNQVSNTTYEQTVRQLRRQLDEALFMVDKAKKEGQFNLGLLRGENESALKLMNEQIVRVEGEKELLRGELAKMRAYYEAKIQEKNVLLEQTTAEFQALCQTKEQTLITYRTNSEQEMSELVRKIESMAELNERYLRQSTQFSALQRELHELRYSLKRMKGMNDGVDHLWQVKETEYFNLNEILQQIRLY